MKTKTSLFIIGSFLVIACSGYQVEQGQQGAVIYLSTAAGNPELLEQFPCSEKPGKKGVRVCHVPPGNPAAKHTICIGYPAVDAHVGHHIAQNGEEDYLGACNDSESSPNPVPDECGNDENAEPGEGNSGGATGIEPD